VKRPNPEKFRAYLPLVFSIVVAGAFYATLNKLHIDGLIDVMKDDFKAPAAWIESLNLWGEPKFPTEFIDAHTDKFLTLMVLWSSWKAMNQKPLRMLEYRIRFPLPAFAEWPRQDPKYDTLSPFNSQNKFLFRTAEMSNLRVFVGSGPPDTPAIKFIFGCEGVGKTRLVDEVLQVFELHGWHVGWIKPGTTAEEIDESKVQSRTALAIDNFETFSELGSVLTALCHKSKNIRIFVVGGGSPDSVSGLQVSTFERLGKYCDKPLFVAPLTSAEIEKLRSPECRWQSSDIRGRPLYALMDQNYDSIMLTRADLFIARGANRGIRDILLAAALAGPIERSDEVSALGLTADVSGLHILFPNERRNLLKRYFPAIEPPILADYVTMRLADEKGDAELKALMSLCIRYNINAVEGRLSRLWKRSASISSNGQDVRIKLQAMFDELAQPRIERLRVDVATATCNLLSASTIFDAQDQTRTLQVSKDYQGRRQKLTALSPHAFYERRDLDNFDSACEIIQEASEIRPFDARIRHLEVIAAGLAIKHYAHTANFRKHKHWIARLKALGEHPSLVQHAEIWEAFSSAWLTAVKTYALMKEADNALACMEFLGEFVERFGSSDPILSLDAVKAGVCAVAVVKAEEIEKSQPVMLAIENLCSRFEGNNRQYTIERAKAYVNLARAYRERGDSAAADQLDNKLKSLTKMPTVAANPEIVASYIQSCVNSGFQLGREGKLDLVGKQLGEVLALWEKWSGRASELLASRVGEVIVNASHAYSKEGRAIEVDHCYEEITDISELARFRESLEIKQQRARVLVNVTDVHRKLANGEEMNRLLREDMQFFRKNRKLKDIFLAQRELQCCCNLMSYYGEVRDFETLEEIGKTTLEFAGSKFASNQEVTDSILRTAKNAVIDYGRAGLERSEPYRIWRNILDRIDDSSIDAVISKSVAKHVGSRQ
jgi:tetratricopeptide (TPR) repeat protein